MFDESDPTAPTAPSPERAPSPPTAPSPANAPAPARYAYLVGRLRGRQITMEEATELFELQQQMVMRARLAAVVVANPTPISPTVRTVRSVGPPAATGPSAAGPSPDILWETLPALAGALGIFAALLKRAQSGASLPPLRETPPPRSGSSPPTSP